MGKYSSRQLLLRARARACRTPFQKRARNSCSSPRRQRLRQPQPSPRTPAAAPHTHGEHNSGEPVGLWKGRRGAERIWERRRRLAARREHTWGSRAGQEQRGSVPTALAESCIPPRCHHFLLLTGITTRSHKLCLADETNRANNAIIL